MSAVLDRIIEEVRTLSPEEMQQLQELLDKEVESAKRALRDSLITSVRGKYRDVLTSSDEFIARKAEEIKLEDRHFSR